MKKNKEIVVWDLLRQLREITKYLSETTGNLFDSHGGPNGHRPMPPHQMSNNALIPELSDDTSSNNTSSTPVSRRYKT